ncbi:Ribosomal protein L11, N-terminal [Pseudocohnilembus persalinus]|uniref:Ribosomal protein L11, N-terminal n=1 Tax=Pseudocohnilembus persalinus TaxID=266149 RepID=A0A0V0QX66_PSEPJ|nr:Ribosomal protein L11, N-terminal [Pseudocohnilembus persalinus]|eukprot:KRX06453.1 Ribosomal protein L11, N-terminal [Pseudocohnilembus persalinus]
MPPKVDPNEIKYIRIKVFGGEGGPAATLAPKLGPLGLNAKKVQEDIVKAGKKDYHGIRCMVELKCQNRAATISVMPTSSALIIKELGNHARDRKKVKNVTHSGDLTLEAIKRIAKVMETENKSMARTFAGTVKQVLGTANSIGCTVNGSKPKDIIAKINNGEIVV